MNTTAETTTTRVKRILVATDFSEGAAGAIRRGVALATDHEAQIHLVHAISSDVRGSLPLEFQQAASARMEDLEREIAASGCAVASTCRAGRPWQVITDVERETKPDLLVIGKRGHTAYLRLLLGSTTDRVVRAASAPVLTIGPDAEAEEPEITTIIAATDFSRGAAGAARAALGLLRPGATGGRLILLHAWHPIVDVYGLGTQATVLCEPVGETEVELRGLLDAQADELHGDGYAVETEITEGYPAQVIERIAKERGADLIAMGTHGHGVVQHLLLGSVAERVLHHAGCPVLTVRQSSASGRATGRDEQVEADLTAAAEPAPPAS